MKLPRNYFENLSSIKYKEYLKLLPNMKKESTKTITMLIFTFISLSLLSLFAISPTLGTIVELQKQLEDSKFVYDELNTKMNSLSSLQQQYTLISSDLPLVFDAIPKNPASGSLVAQIQGIAARTNVQLVSIRLGEAVVKDKQESKKIEGTVSPFPFVLEVEGNYENFIEFASSLSFFDRIVTIEAITLTKNPRTSSLIFIVKGKQYFKP